MLLYAIILTGSGLAIDSTQHDQSIASGSSNGAVAEISIPESTILVLPTVGSSERTPLTSGNQSSEFEYKVVKIKDIEETLNTRIEPNNPLVHDEALQMLAKLSEPGDSTLNQTCSIYDYLKNGISPIKGWTYARDPRGLDYFNYANESIRVGERSCTGVGDCDDFAILMASFVESIGGTTRIILAFNNSTGGHAYAEVYLGNLGSQPSQVNDTIEWLKHKYSTNHIFTYNDTETGDVWLNLDWGLDEIGYAHPGGPFCQAGKKIVIIVRGMFKKTSLTMPPTSENNVTSQAPAIQLNIMPNLTESNSAGVWFNKGIALGYLGKFEDAIQAYDKAIEIDPQYANAWYNKAFALGKLGRTSESKEALNKAKELESEGSTGKSMPETMTRSSGQTTASDWFDKGLALYNQGKYDEAIRAYDKAIEIDPQYTNAWYNKAFALGKLGRTSESKEALNKAKELESEDSTGKPLPRANNSS